MRKVVFETDRLELCVPCLADVDALAGYWGDPETMRYLGINGDVWTREQVVERVERGARFCDEHGMTFWTVVEKATRAVIGQGGLVPIAFDGDEVELGYRFGKEHWGKGYATEVARASAAYGFGVLGLDRLVAVSFPGNVASRKVLMKVGFEALGESGLYYGKVLILFEMMKR
ncbi:MAG: GNAT family N-acetyltransferase [Phycisphaerales bacterium]|nr:GNAT family N-acetyltransferase [Phycisphaerales bacterium]